jgi:asparagine synthase (glutamine-hydrolysing)
LGDYLVNSPIFADELAAFSKSDIFQIPYLQNINSQKLVDKLQKEIAQ